MNLAPDDNLALIVETARRFGEDALTPRIRTAEADRAVDSETRRAFAEIGLAGLELPENVGGAGLGSVARVLVNEELGATDAAAALALDELGPALYPIIEMGGDVTRFAEKGGRVLLFATQGERAMNQMTRTETFRPFKTGDFIEAGGVAGIVEEVQVFASRIRTPDNKQIVIPNSAITSGSITNYSAKETRRVDLPSGISYDDDLVRAFRRGLHGRQRRGHAHGRRRH